MRVSFDELANELATNRGAYTLWIGAGASIALTRGQTPGWQDLIGKIRAKHNLPNPGEVIDMPRQLEQLSETVGHAVFRRELRDHLIGAIEPTQLDADILACQAVIGARAASVVSFNIEPYTSMPFLFGRGGGAISYRTFRERSKYALSGDLKIGTGVVSPPVYFPHGLLIQANVVMTQSEYDLHMGGFAVSTATHLAIGGDLVILGMSLADSYLRDALLKNRTWIRDIFWLDSSFQFREWARMARVTCVEIQHNRVWSELADTIATSDASGDLPKIRDHVRSECPPLLEEAIKTEAAYYEIAREHARQLVGVRTFGVEHITALASFFEDIGMPVPDFLRSDPRCRV